MITVATVLWQGDFKPSKYVHPGYDPEWVQKVCNMVARNLSLEYELELFRNDLPIKGDRILYLDLDIVITSDLTVLLEYAWDAEIMICSPFGTDRGNWKKEKKVFGYNSSVMVFKNPITFQIWKKFIQRPKYWMNTYRSDQDYMKVNFPDFPMFPDKWICKTDTYITKGNGKMTGQSSSTMSCRDSSTSQRPRPCSTRERPTRSSRPATC
ncbi:hypothetical protein LCGC14_3007220 [marine sediment metagenome]|uniref:Nucleotide-diphospho-sugar transferase domain-containing protein n=1 Tax=marine sediment metagenome TaxID=412755 RepID=A0A0F8WZR3_9ZZZZ